MRQTTVCFLTKEDRVLLGMKKRGFGKGKWNGFGGKCEEGETPSVAMVRELKEEIGVSISEDDLIPFGLLHFNFKDNESWNQECHIFRVTRWDGEPSESEEMAPKWYPFNALPFESMWIDDPHWLPLVLAGKKIEGRFFFDESGDELINFAVSPK